MSQIRIAGVKRNTKYSPNHIGNDGMIFSMTAEYLRNMGYDVSEYTESEFVLSQEKEMYIFNMAREKTTLKRLKECEKDGAIIINPASGIENCTREQMTRLLLDNGVPHPKSIIAEVTDDPTDALTSMSTNAFWVKRGDSHTIHREDVTYARNIPEAKSILQEFAFRDIPNAVINEHLVGDLVKFYGVAGTEFFYWFYPYDLSLTKFGLEAINGEAKEFSFDINALKEACNKAGDILDVDIYGGDCIIAADGSFKIIDFNDWPSFAPCREQAIPYIAQRISQKISESSPSAIAH
ncbi:hypothetical protein JGH11_00720 [Dysgonomonas sp. Marseille-P4677]|uniref:hypothetical protein n=1 Tax=Dysgonomonas sp. Marseille-P4677 TaxID=2364790 RepID=UPI00191457AD|nr:hypothetical protein [Dysgonomonas sp. Marseille-P4677]MBK5719382.1 hypothetical protein [Dysgonomonas sp. Marseille-P4677]